MDRFVARSEYNRLNTQLPELRLKLSILDVYFRTRPHCCPIASTGHPRWYPPPSKGSPSKLRSPTHHRFFYHPQPNNHVTRDLPIRSRRTVRTSVPKKQRNKKKTHSNTNVLCRYPVVSVIYFLTATSVIPRLWNSLEFQQFCARTMNRRSTDQHSKILPMN